MSSSCDLLLVSLWCHCCSPPLPPPPPLSTSSLHPTSTVVSSLFLGGRDKLRLPVAVADLADQGKRWRRCASTKSAGEEAAGSGGGVPRRSWREKQAAATRARLMRRWRAESNRSSVHAAAWMCGVVREVARARACGTARHDSEGPDAIERERSTCLGGRTKRMLSGAQECRAL